LTGGLDGETEETIDAKAALLWAVYQPHRIEQLLMKLCQASGIKDP